MIYVIGIGPGGKEYMTLEAIEAIKNSDVISIKIMEQLLLLAE